MPVSDFMFLLAEAQAQQGAVRPGVGGIDRLRPHPRHPRAGHQAQARQVARQVGDQRITDRLDVDAVCHYGTRSARNE